MIKKEHLDKELIKKFNLHELKLRERHIPKVEHTHPDIFDDEHWLIYLECDDPYVYINTNKFPIITIEKINEEVILGTTIYDKTKTTEMMLESVEKILNFIKENKSNGNK